MLDGLYRPIKLYTIEFLVKAKFHYAMQLANLLASWFASWSATC